MHQLVPSFAVAQIHRLATGDGLDQTMFRERVGNLFSDPLAVRVVGSGIERRRWAGVVVDVVEQLVSGSECHDGEASVQPVLRVVSIIAGGFDEGECTDGVLKCHILFLCRLIAGATHESTKSVFEE